MSDRPVIRKTYGRQSRPSSSATAPASSIFFPAQPAPPWSPDTTPSNKRTRSSSPPTSSPVTIATPRIDGSERDDVYEGRSSSPVPSASTSSQRQPIHQGAALPRVVNDDVTSTTLSKGRGTLTAPPTQRTLQSFFLPSPKSKKRPLHPTRIVPSPAEPSISSIASSSKVTVTPSSSTGQGIGALKSKPRSKQQLLQTHLTHLPLLQTCQECQMSYVRGGGEDESLHARHHSRVVKGIPWEGLGRYSPPKPPVGTSSIASGSGRDKTGDQGWRIVMDDVVFGSGKSRDKGKGKVVMCDGSWGGSKLAEILDMVDTVLSAPSLSPAILERCKIFLFITSSTSPVTTTTSSTGNKRLKPTTTSSMTGMSSEKRPKERIVSVVVAQPIKVAMRVLPRDQAELVGSEDKEPMVVDSGGGTVCDPTPLPTPLGIHRIFTIPRYRSLGLSRVLLDASCRHSIYGLRPDPTRGQVAFSQPTESGRMVMERWGRGGVRVFVDDERQL